MCCYLWPLSMIYHECVLLDVCGICLSLEKIHHRLHTKNIQISYNGKQHNINNYLFMMRLVCHVDPGNIVISWQILCNLSIGAVPELSSCSVRLYEKKNMFIIKRNKKLTQSMNNCVNFLIIFFGKQHCIWDWLV